jgi:transcriptional regulator with XRE-family HTH domain
MTRRYKKSDDDALPEDVEQFRAEIGRRLRAVRFVANQTQQAFAASIDAKQNSYQKWESGALFPDPVALMKVCARHQVHFNFLYGGDFAGIDGSIAVKLAQFLAVSKSA